MPTNNPGHRQGRRRRPEYHGVVDEVLKVFGGIRGPFSILLHSPKLAERLLKARHLQSRGKRRRPAKLRSLAILAAVREREAAYVWAAQVGAARRAGVPRGGHRPAPRQGRPRGLPGEERDIVNYTRQLMRTNRVRPGGVRPR